jgi:two-component system, sensor histidine kinase and response regulator
MNLLYRWVAVSVLAGAAVGALTLPAPGRVATGLLGAAAIGLLAVLEFRTHRVLAALRRRSAWFEQRLAGSETELAQTREKLGSHAVVTARTTAQRDKIFEMAMDMICVAGTDGYFRRVNPAFTRTLGYSQEELVSRPFIDFVHPDDREATMAELASLAAGKDCIDFENRYCAKDGSYRWLAWRCPAAVEGTNVLYAIARDVTDRKRVEMELRRAMAATEAASRARSEFVANMSHEIRTPLNGIVGMVELALETNLSPHVRDYLETINQSAELLLMIVNDVLDFSKMESGKFQLDSTSFGLRETLGQTLQALAPRAHLKGLELAFHISPDVPDALIGDPVRLRQTVTNLVGNAIKFTDHGEVLLHVEKSAESPVADDGKGRVQLHFLVRDTGIGVPADKQDKIFEAFSQADMSTTRKYGGTGLGLTISSYLIQQMQGRIWLESREREGSRFHFNAWFGVPSSAPEKTAPRCFPGIPVLAVDDNATNLRIVDEMLRLLEMKPTLAASGAEALAEFDAAQEAGQPFPLAIIDFHMPEMDGFALAQRLLASQAAPAVIVLTSSDRPIDCERFEQLGVAAHLPKPVRQQRLIEAISNALGKPAGPATANAPPALPPSFAGPPLRILVAEDSAVNQKLVLELLGRRGHSATLAINGQEAVHFWEAQPFDVVLMDVQMPELDGLEATRQIRIRERETDRRTPIIAMTAHAMRGDRERCLAAGMDDYLAKPIRAGQLFAKLDELGGAPRGKGESPPPSNSAAPDGAAIRWREAVSDLGGDEDLLRDLGSTLLDDVPRLMEKVRRAVESGDPEKLSRAAHILKGSIRPFAALRAFEYAFRLEKMGCDQELDHAAETFAELEQEMAGVVASVQEHVR